MFLDLVETRRAEHKCCCWDCLREAGLTPPAAIVENFPTLRGKIHSSMDGEEVGRVKSQKQEQDESDAKYLMERGRGQDD